MSFFDSILSLLGLGGDAATEDARAWLSEHAAAIRAFTDYDPAPCSDRSLRDDLRHHWFRAAEWNAPGYRFRSLGGTGTGGLLALWVRPGADGPHPVVFFGSEGGYGVLVATSERWLQALAHGPMIREHASPARLVRDNWMLDEPGEAATEALAAYRSAVVERRGQLPALEVLTGELDALQQEFCGWAGGVRAAVEAEEARAREQHQAALASHRAELEAIVERGERACPKCGCKELRVLSNMAHLKSRLGCRGCGRSFE